MQALAGPSIASADQWSTLDKLGAQCEARVTKINAEYQQAKRTAAMMAFVAALIAAVGALAAALLPTKRARVITAIVAAVVSVLPSINGLLPDVQELGELRSLVIQHQRVGRSVHFQLEYVKTQEAYQFVVDRYNDCVSPIPDPKVDDPPGGYRGQGKVGDDI